ncbi:MAG: PIN domain-containing protein [Acidobacteria bacterium]|nr:PIN domain-containing protein [Acidobacteriota bacterium]
MLRLTAAKEPAHIFAQQSIRILQSRSSSMFYTLQNAAEFWNVATRPVERNGHGLSPAEAAEALSRIEMSMTLLPDDSNVYSHWRHLLEVHNIRGVQVHDAKLAAAMLAHNVPSILTFNASDFARFSSIEAVHPATLIV